MVPAFSKTYTRGKVLNAWLQQGPPAAAVMDIMRKGRILRATKLLYGDDVRLVRNVLAIAHRSCKRLDEYCSDTIIGWPFHELLTHIQRSVMDPTEAPYGVGLKPYSDHLLHSCILAQIGWEALSKATISPTLPLAGSVVQSLNTQLSPQNRRVWPSLTALAGVLRDHWEDRKFPVKENELLGNVQTLFNPSCHDMVQNMVMRRLMVLWHVTALYHDVGYHIAAMRVIIGENAPKQGVSFPVYSSLEGMRKANEMGTFEKPLWNLVAALSPFKPKDELGNMKKRLYEIQNLNLSSEVYDKFVFVKLGQLHPFWSAVELIRTASYLGESEQFKKNPFRTFEKQVMLAIAASIVCTHHVLSVGDLSKPRVDKSQEKPIQDVFKSLASFQRQAKKLTFENWPLGYLLHVLDSCDVLSRIKLKPAVPKPIMDEKTHETVRELRIRITEGSDEAKLHLESPVRQSALRITVDKGESNRKSGGKVEQQSKEEARQKKEAEERFRYFAKVVNGTRVGKRKKTAIHLRLASKTKGHKKR